MSHTPGPWSAVEIGESGDGSPLFEIRGANGRLVADLVSAADAAVIVNAYGAACERLASVAHAALAKAEGK